MNEKDNKLKEFGFLMDDAKKKIDNIVIEISNKDQAIIQKEDQLNTVSLQLNAAKSALMRSAVELDGTRTELDAIKDSVGDYKLQIANLRLAEDGLNADIEKARAVLEKTNLQLEFANNALIETERMSAKYEDLYRSNYKKLEISILNSLTRNNQSCGMGHITLDYQDGRFSVKYKKVGECMANSAKNSDLLSQIDINDARKIVSLIGEIGPATDAGIELIQKEFDEFNVINRQLEDNELSKSVNKEDRRSDKADIISAYSRKFMKKAEDLQKNYLKLINDEIDRLEKQL